MFATVVLGVFIAALFLVGMRNIYSNFFKGTATCCKTDCASCPMHNVHDNYRTRVEAIEKFKIKKSIEVDGMTCEKCVNNVVKALEKVEGVVIAAASVEKKSAKLALDRNVDENILDDAIKNAGYKPGVCVNF